MEKNLNTLLDIQLRQHDHDKLYHPDILALTTADRLKHMALHNAKYAAKFCDAEFEGSDIAFEKVLVDAFVIAIATANTLTVNLTQTVSSNTTVTQSHADLKNTPPFSHRYIREVGLMAKACESIDHLEDFPFRTTIMKTNLNIINLLIEEAKKRNLNIADNYINRLVDVESKSGFRFFDTKTLT